MDRYDLINDWFEAYVSSYVVEDSVFNDKALLKKNHSYRVVSNIRKLALSLELNELDTEIVSCLALLHDVGRFEQLKKYTDRKYGNVNQAKSKSPIRNMEKVEKRTLHVKRGSMPSILSQPKSDLKNTRATTLQTTPISQTTQNRSKDRKFSFRNSISAFETPIL